MWNQSDSNDSKKMNVSISALDEDNLLADNNCKKIDNNISPSSGFNNNTNNQKTKFDSSVAAAQYSGGVDSGFLSGSHLESCEIDYDDDDEEETEVKESDIKNKSVTTTSTVASCAPVAAANFNIESGYIDSGCIEEEEEEEVKKVKFIQPSSQQQQSAAAAIRFDKGTETEFTENMILDSEIDSGLTEWFCNLSLKTNQPLNNLGSLSPITDDGDNKKLIKDLNEAKNQKWQIYYTQNNEGDTQLHLACITGYVNVIAALIRMAPHPCLLDIQNDEAQSALHIATLTAQPLVIRMLLIAGAEPTLRDRNGNTALHLACITGDLQCVKALTIPISSSELHESQRLSSSSATATIIANQSSSPSLLKNNNSTERTIQYFPCAQLPTDLEIRNYDGERCVHLAAQGSHIDVLRHLIWFGADVNAREGKSGRTPLHISIEQCNENLANFLLEECQHKINLETVTYSGLTAYQFARVLQNYKLQNDLQKRGAETLSPPESDTDGSDIESEFDDSQVSLPVN